MKKPKKEVTMLAKHVRTVLRLKAGGASNKIMSGAVGVSPSTVKRWKDVSESSGVDFHTVETMTDVEVEQVFRQKPGPKLAQRYPINLEQVVGGLEDGPTILETYEAYRTEGEAAVQNGLTTAIPLSQSSYFSQVQKQLKQIKGEPSYSMQTWKYGEYVLIDIAGDTIVLAPDKTGHRIVCYVYVAISPATNLIYGRVMPDRSGVQWNLSIVSTFTCIGGLPKHIKCDNEKALIVDATFGNKKLSEGLQELVAIYQNKFDIEACRVRQPRDKGPVEWAVKRVTDTFINKVKPGSLLTVEDAQVALEAAVAKLNLTVSPRTGISPLRHFQLREQGKFTELPDFKYDPRGKIYRYTIKHPGHVVLIEGHSYLCDYRYKYDQIDAYVGKDGLLHFLSVADGSPLWDYPHYEYGNPDPVEQFRHAKDEFRAPHELTADTYLTKEKESFAKLGAGAQKFLDQFMLLNRYKGKYGIGNQLSLLRHELEKYPPELLNEAMEHVCAIGKPTVDLVTTFVKAYADGAKLQKKRKPQSNRGACLREGSALVPKLKSANSTVNTAKKQELETK